MNFICMSCPTGSPAYNSLQELQAHMKSVHTAARRAEYAVPKSLAEAAEQVRKNPNAPLPKPTPAVPPPPPTPPEPIVLNYVYAGQCPKDRGIITTIELDIEGKHFVLALCNTCHTQLKIFEVADLKKICHEELEKMEQNLDFKKAVPHGIQERKVKR